MKNRVTELFSIKYPIVQGGMIWNSGWRLASAVSNAGGLGLIGAGSMYPEVLKLHIERCKAATNKPFGVNVPLLYPNIEEIIELIIEYKVPIVFTSAGNPATHTARLKAAGITVVHVVSSTKFALKAEAAGVDAIVAEGFEAGGHNGRDESTTLTLIPSVRRATSLPLIAAGGIATGEAMLATMILGADGVQMGSRFVASEESSGHQLFKDLVVAAGEGATELTLKELTPVRLLKNKFYQDLQKLYQSGASIEELRAHLGRARAKRGMFEGDLEEGELEIGQIASMIDAVKPAASIIEEIMAQYHQALGSLPPRFSFDQ
ncbi:nitronate monooxygenase [Flavobacteriaceae bacterium]|nr:nitronate monooxygenase [Flavobacteriaceae bacterium]